MTAAERASGLAAAARTRREGLLALAGVVAGQAPVRVLEAPAARVVAVRLGTGAGELPLVDAVVTTAAVQVGGDRGWACVLGWDDRAVLAAAICDARPGDAVTDLAQGALADERERAAAADAEVAATRVSPG
jgi:alpha-D-ribose 1-methylphosphonate 5-triphosphate synthase subunit PhnG